ncbi:MAG: arginase family protein, partial [Planctomycetota bacterium]
MHPTFLGEEEKTGEEGARFLVFPVPYEKTTSYLRGCADGPRAILHASTQVETYDEEAACEPHRAGIHTLPFFQDAPRPEDLPDRLKTMVEPWARAGRFTVTLGGEHAVSLGPVQAYREVHSDLSVLQLDAHADLRDRYEGSRFSHACVGKRIQEVAPLVQAGIRSLSGEEAETLPSLKVRTFFRKDQRLLDAKGIEAVIDALTDRVYLSL